MKISLNWIRRYVDLPSDIDMKKLSHDLTMSTVEVEDAVDLKKDLENIVIGRILSVEPHPKADRLRVTKVDIGEAEPSQIVCGGSNLKVGQDVVVAKVGSFVKWHGEGEPVEIKPAELRGVPSAGMICGASEISMEDLFPAEEEHIIMDVTSLKAEPGTPVADALGLDDTILEIDNKSLTNRPDLWGHYGIARELAAIYKLPLKPLRKFMCPEVPQFPVEILDKVRCTRFTAVVYEGVKNEVSPLWLQTDLWKVGMRPISSIVDITNWVMLATGEPTHAYDLKNVKDGIIVRNADEDERLTLLDGEELTLSGRNLVIADREKAMGLAGIMGGINDSIHSDTDSIVLESASFCPSSVRATATEFGLRTEASMRFEKGIDQERVDITQALTEDLIREMYPEARITMCSDVRPVEDVKVEVLVSEEFLNTRLGMDMDSHEVEGLLSPLGFTLEKNEGVYRVSVPSWRATGDVDLPDDILEEVARMIGYDNFRYSPPRITLTEAINQKEYDIDRSVREYLASRCGMQEVYTYPWTDISYIRAAGIDTSDMVQLSAPPSPKEENLRSSLVPGILEVISDNLRYFESFRVFESTQVYRMGEVSKDMAEEKLPVMEREVVGAVVGDDAMTVLREAKGILEYLPRYTMCSPITFTQTERPTWADKKAYLNIMCEGRNIGSVCLLSLKTMMDAGIKRRQVAVFSFSLDSLVPFHSRDNRFQHLPSFPLTHKDLSLLVSTDRRWEEISDIVAPMVRELKFVEEYRGKQVPEEMKSITLSVSFGSEEGTLTNDQIEAKMDTIISALTEKLNATVRGI